MNCIRYEGEVAWCGSTLTGFYFKDIEQALINNLHGERKICPDCVAAIIESLKIVPELAKLTEWEQSNTM